MKVISKINGIILSTETKTVYFILLHFFLNRKKYIFISSDILKRAYRIYRRKERVMHILINWQKQLFASNITKTSMYLICL